MLQEINLQFIVPADADKDEGVPSCKRSNKHVAVVLDSDIQFRLNAKKLGLPMEVAKTKYGSAMIFHGNVERTFQYIAHRHI